MNAERAVAEWGLTMDVKDFSRAKIGKLIFVYILLFLAGDLLNSLLFDLLFSVVHLQIREFYYLLRMGGCLAVTYFLFWFYTTKVLQMNMKAFGITFAVDNRGILSAIILPVFVVFIFLLIGDTAVHKFSFGEILLIVAVSVMTSVKSGILEEMLFRGYIMRLIESGWNKYSAIMLPSVLFGLLHLPSMETFGFSSVLLLVFSGTLVGIMFSVIAYKQNSIGNSVLLHAAWNFVMITDILHITTEQEAYGNPIVSVIIPSDNIFLTGGGFGVEASVVAIIGYCIVCGFVLFTNKKNLT